MKAYRGTEIGQPMPAFDATEKVTGTAIYADDLGFARLLHGAVLHSEHAHARIVSIDTSEAEALPGVHAVITYKDSPDVLFNRIMRHAADPIPATERVLDMIVRHVGDEVAAVAADTEELARKAVKLIKVEYEVLPAVLDPEKALQEDSVRLYEEGNLMHTQQKECGDVDKALEEAECTVENMVETAMIHHAAIEPHLCIAQWAKNGELSVWAPIQAVFRIQLILGKIFSLPYSKIHVHSPLIGGTFGGKDSVMLEPLCLLLSKKAGGRPVKIRYNRKESMLSTYTRHAMRLYGKMGFTKQGKITGFNVDNYMNVGPYCGGSVNVHAAMCGKMFKIYDVPNMRFNGKAAYTNAMVGGAMRGFGSPKVFLCLEHLVNKAARQLDMDPALFRRQNLIEAFGEEPGSGAPHGSAQAQACLNEGMARFNWCEKWAARKNLEDERYVYGYGVSTAMHGNGVAPFAPDITLADLMLHEDGSLILRCAVTDHGAGSNTLMRQIVAEVLQAPMDEVDHVLPSTQSCPYDMGSGASRNTWSAGSSVEKAAVQLKQMMLETAAIAFECSVDDVQLKDGLFNAPDGRTMTRRDLNAYAYSTQRTKLATLARYNSDTNAGSYGAHFAKVRIDKQTGEVCVMDYLAMCDIGTPLSPLLLEGQLDGAVMMGLGMVLFEGIQLNEAGTPQNASFKKYRLPKASDLPNLDVQFVDNYEEGGPFGGKSVGESSIVPVVPAIVGAINDALDAELGHLPLTPEKILAALQSR